MVPQILGQSDGEEFYGPDWIDYSNKYNGIVDLMGKISCSS